ncbi:sacsin-like [Alca torda]
MALKHPNVETFCQRAPTFLDYLHNILQKYPDGGQILKAQPSWPTMTPQCPPRDWTGLMRPGVSHKREDPSTVGRFGLGFTSVYHLTDLPGVLSPPSLGVLDPECQVLSDAGGRWDISAAQDFPGLFEPFWAGLEAVGQHRGSPQGTLFRFPLRRHPSGIAAGVSDPERLRSLLQTFLTEAPLALSSSAMSAVWPCTAWPLMGHRRDSHRAAAPHSAPFALLR